MATVNEINQALCPKLALLYRTHVGPNAQQIFHLQSYKNARKRIGKHLEQFTRLSDLRQSLETTMVTHKIKDTKTYQAIVTRHKKTKEREAKARESLQRAQKTKANAGAKAKKENEKWNRLNSNHG